MAFFLLGLVFLFFLHEGGNWGGHDRFANLWHNGETNWPVSFPVGHAVIIFYSTVPVTSMYEGGVENDWFGVKQDEDWYKDKRGL